MILVTANVYYEDSPNKRMIPSEISILKFSIGRGIYDQRHYILGFPENEVLYGNSKAKAEQNGMLFGFVFTV